MGDRLEKFIEENKQSFDDLEVRDELWKGIDEKLRHSEKSSNTFNVYWKVATVIFFLSTTYLMSEKWFERQEEKVVISNELVEVESYYINQISQQKEKLSQVDQTKINMTLAELDRLEKNYLALKKQLEKVGGQERLKAALIQNLRWRLQILNKQTIFLEYGDQSFQNVKDEKEI